MLLHMVFLLKIIYTSENLSGLQNIIHSTKDEQKSNAGTSINIDENIFGLNFMGIDKEMDYSKEQKLYFNSIMLFGNDNFEPKCIICKSDLQHTVFKFSLKHQIEHFKINSFYEPFCYNCLKNENFKECKSHPHLLHCKVLFEKWVLVFPTFIVANLTMLNFQYLNNENKLKTLKLCFNYSVSNAFEAILNGQIFEKDYNSLEARVKNNFYLIITKLITNATIYIFKDKETKGGINKATEMIKNKIDLVVNNRKMINEIWVRVDFSEYINEYEDCKYIILNNLNIIDTKKLISLLKNLAIHGDLKLDFEGSKKLRVDYQLKNKKCKSLGVYNDIINQYIETKKNEKYKACITFTILAVILLENNDFFNNFLKLNDNRLSQENFFQVFIQKLNGIKLKKTIGFSQPTEPFCTKGIISQYNESAYEIMDFILNLYKSLYKNKVI